MYMYMCILMRVCKLLSDSRILEANLLSILELGIMIHFISIIQLYLSEHYVFCKKKNDSVWTEWFIVLTACQLV